MMRCPLSSRADLGDVRSLNVGCNGRRDQVLTHLALLKPALWAWRVRWGPVLASRRRVVVGVAVLCDSGLKGRFLEAQGAALGDGPPKKTMCSRPEGPLSMRVCFNVHVRGDQVLTHLALVRSALWAWWVRWARCWSRGVVLWLVLRFFATQARRADFW